MIFELNIFSISSIFSLACNFILFIFLFFELNKNNQNKKRKETLRYYFFLLFIIVFWQSVELLSRIYNFNDHSVVLWRVSMSLTLFLGIIFYYFVRQLTEQKIDARSKAVFFNRSTYFSCYLVNRFCRAWFN